jgi:Beta-lactamase
MLSRLDSVLDLCEPDISRILQIAGTKTCSIHLEMIPWEPRRKGYLDGRSGYDLGNTIFAWGSLSKMVVTVALWTIIEDLANSDLPEYGKYKPLRDAWKRPFVECFNAVSDIKLLDLPDSPKVEQLVAHFAGAPPLNHIIMAPDGTPLISNEAFPTVLRQYTIDTYGESEGYRARWDYSNGNTILIGLLIEAASGMLLPDFIDRYVFKKLGLPSAYMGVNPDGQNAALPHEVSAEGTIPISLPQSLSDPLCIAAMGVCSNTLDIAFFFRLIVESILKNLDEGDTKPTAISYLCKPSASMGVEAGSRYYPCGISTTLDTTDPGSQSLNRLVSPTSVSSTYTLGIEQPNQPLRVFYHAGVVNGFECCAYIIPTWRTFLIVQSDTSGRVDATDHISRLILQTLFNLGPRTGQRVNILGMAEQGAEERARLLAEFTRSQSVSDNDAAIHPSHIVGTYSHDNYRQTLSITEKEDKLWIQWQGSREVDGRPVLSDVMQLLRVDATRVRMKVRFTIDLYDAWRDLDFVLSRDASQQVTSLSRRDPNAAHFITYTRLPQSLP